MDINGVHEACTLFQSGPWTGLFLSFATKKSKEPLRLWRKKRNAECIAAVMTSPTNHVLSPLKLFPSGIQHLTFPFITFSARSVGTIASRGCVRSSESARDILLWSKVLRLRRADGKRVQVFNSPAQLITRRFSKNSTGSTPMHDSRDSSKRTKTSTSFISR